MRIIIIGAGIGGATLGAALKKWCPAIDIKLFERAKYALSYSQGDDLLMKPDGGIEVLKSLGLWEESAFHRRNVRGFYYLSERGDILLSRSRTRRGERPEKGLVYGLARGWLRSTLLNQLELPDVSYDKEFTSYRQTNDGVTATFHDGSECYGDLIVGCDGANSRVRKQMIGDCARYLGLSTVRGMTGDGWQMPLLEKGTLIALGPASSIIVQKYHSSGIIHWSYTTRCQQGYLRIFEPNRLREWIAEQLESWKPNYAGLIRSSPLTSMRVKGIYDRTPTRMTLSQRALLIGDAAHPMSPFHGEGANTAMVDGLRLAKTLVGVMSVGKNLDEALHSFNDDMFSRTKNVVIASRKAAYSYHSSSSAYRRLRNSGLRLLHSIYKIQGQNIRSEDS